MIGGLAQTAHIFTGLNRAIVRGGPYTPLNISNLMTLQPTGRSLATMLAKGACSI
jgi:hypothetical protein